MKALTTTDLTENREQIINMISQFVVVASTHQMEVLSRIMKVMLNTVNAGGYNGTIEQLTAQSIHTAYTYDFIYGHIPFSARKKMEELLNN